MLGRLQDRLPILRRKLNDLSTEALKFGCPVIGLNVLRRPGYGVVETEAAQVCAFDQVLQCHLALSLSHAEFAGRQRNHLDRIAFDLLLLSLCDLIAEGIELGRLEGGSNDVADLSPKRGVGLAAGFIAEQGEGLLVRQFMPGSGVILANRTLAEGGKVRAEAVINATKNRKGTHPDLGIADRDGRGQNPNDVMLTVAEGAALRFKLAGDLRIDRLDIEATVSDLHRHDVDAEVLERRNSRKRKVLVFEWSIGLAQEGPGVVIQHSDHSVLGALLKPAIDVRRKKVRRLSPHLVIVFCGNLAVLADLIVGDLIDANGKLTGDVQFKGWLKAEVAGIDDHVFLCVGAAFDLGNEIVKGASGFHRVLHQGFSRPVDRPDDIQPWSPAGVQSVFSAEIHRHDHRLSPGAGLYHRGGYLPSPLKTGENDPMAKKASTKKTSSARSKNKADGNTRKRAQAAAPEPAAAAAPKGGPTDDARAIKKSDFDKFIKSYRAMRKEAQDATSNVGGLVSNYTENHRLHKKAFGLIKVLDRMRENPVGLAELLFHFDVMREHGGYDKIAASDMLKDRNRTEQNVRKRNVGKDAAAEQGGGDDDDTAEQAVDGPDMAGKTDFGGESPFRQISDAGDEVIAEAERRLN